MSENQTSTSPAGPQRAASPLRPLAPASLNFVFGQNLEDRVILPAGSAPQPASAPPGEEKKEPEAEPQASTSKSDASSETSKEAAEPVVTTTDNGTTKRVIEPAIGAGAAAAKDAAAVIQKRKYEATIVTGEEDESNVLQIHCKLYHWETDDSVWKEKGKGFLKLNDKKSREDRLSSRLSQFFSHLPLSPYLL